MADAKNMGVAIRPSGTETLEGLTPIEQLRQDFRMVFHYWRNTGQIDKDEMTTDMRDAGASIKRNRQNPDWMRACASHFRQMASDIERDIARSERIKAEEEAKRLAERLEEGRVAA